MIVYVKSNCTVTQQLAYSVVEHCYQQLMYGHDVNIFIKLKSKLANNLDGWCQHNYNNNYDIAVDSSQTTKSLIRTLCHEMVHVKQGVKNELTYTHNDKYCRRWKGVEYTTECPWEIEAYELEEDLLQTFMEKYNEKAQAVRRSI